MVADAGLNDGLILRCGDAADASNGDTERTIIITGIARSGTTMMAAVLRQAGLFIGEKVYETEEDVAIVHIASGRLKDHLPDLIAQRNQRHSIWGFKLPNLHAQFSWRDLALFRNLRLVVVYRDPVAVSLRHSLAERFEEEEDTLYASIRALEAQTRFIDKGGRPALLVSYEKMITVPEKILGSIFEFCAVSPNADAMKGIINKIKPNNERYISGATRNFSGSVDHILENRLSGWCQEWHSLIPILVDLFIDGELVDSQVSDVFRADLLEAGIGNGAHGFIFDLDRHKISDESIVRVKINRRTVELANSGKKLREYHVKGVGERPE